MLLFTQENEESTDEMKNDFEKGMSELDSFITGGYSYLANNAGKAIAAITVIIAVLVTFTDVTFSSFGGESFTGGLLVMLFSSYVIYFSLEGSGEKLGETTEEFITALKRYTEAKNSISAEDIGALREFCYSYSQKEAEYRKKNYLAESALTEKDLSDFKNGKKFPYLSARRLRRCEKMRIHRLTPATLLSGERLLCKSELKNPESSKFISLILGLIPTTLGTFLTVSVILTTKDSLTFATVMEGILKLSALPIIGFKGYSSGYSYVKCEKSLWIETKARLLEEFKATLPT